MGVTRTCTPQPAHVQVCAEQCAPLKEGGACGENVHIPIVNVFVHVHVHAQETRTRAPLCAGLPREAVILGKRPDGRVSAARSTSHSPTKPITGSLHRFLDRRLGNTEITREFCGCGVRLPEAIFDAIEQGQRSGVGETNTTTASAVDGSAVALLASIAGGTGGDEVVVFIGSTVADSETVIDFEHHVRRKLAAVLTGEVVALKDAPSDRVPGITGESG